MSALAANVAAVRAQITTVALSVGRDPSTIRLIAVSKAQPPSIVGEALALGLNDFGENRPEHAALIAAAIAESAGVETHARIHFIGRLQSRQIPDIVACCASIHSLSDAAHIPRLAAALQRKERSAFPVFVQANISGEASKSGGDADQVARVVELARREPELDVCGLMTMAPLRSGSNDALISDTFARCAALAATLGLSRLSMGMSGDWPLALAAGATDLRIGSALFAEQPPCA